LQGRRSVLKTEDKQKKWVALERNALSGGDVDVEGDMGWVNRDGVDGLDRLSVMDGDGRRLRRRRKEWGEGTGWKVGLGRATGDLVRGVKRRGILNMFRAMKRTSVKTKTDPFRPDERDHRTRGRRRRREGGERTIRYRWEMRTRRRGQLLVYSV
jgi:hypothetical protein